MSKLYIISDCHGNIDGLMRALTKMRITDNHGNRQLGVRHQVYSIGDLANCVGDSIQGDKDCLGLVGDIIDGMIVGNHEIPYIDPANKFWGFVWDNGIAEQIRNLLDNDLVGPSLVVDKTLITHAGLTKQLLPPFEGNNALSIHQRLEEHWENHNYGFSLFSNVGHARQGPDKYGGTLWCDFDAEFTPTDFPQIVGHTPKYVRTKGNALCIDVGAKDQTSEPFILEIS